MIKAKYYKCFSINLLRWLKTHEVQPISKGINKTTGRTYWVFLVDDELSDVLTKWTETKNKMGIGSK